MKSLLDFAKTRHTSCDEECKALHSKNEKLEKDLEDWKYSFEQIHNLITDELAKGTEGTDTDEYKRQYETKIQEIMEAHTKLQEAEQKIRELKKYEELYKDTKRELASLQIKFNELRQRIIKDTSKTTQSYKEMVEKKNKLITTLTTRLEELQSSKSTDLAELEKLRGEIQKLKKVISDLDTEKTQIQRERDLLEGQKEELQRESVEKGEQIASLQTLHKNQREHITGLESKLAKEKQKYERDLGATFNTVSQRPSASVPTPSPRQPPTPQQSPLNNRPRSSSSSSTKSRPPFLPPSKNGPKSLYRTPGFTGRTTLKRNKAKQQRKTRKSNRS